jgi:hypothetical protein
VNTLHTYHCKLEKLDVLESWAREYFEQLRNNSVVRPIIPPDAFGPEQLRVSLPPSPFSLPLSKFSLTSNFKFY